MSHRLRVKVKDNWYTVEIESLETNPVRALVDGEPVDVDVDSLQADAVADMPMPAPVQEAAQTPKPQAAISRTPAPIRVFRAPMPGGILSISVKVGDQVVTGDEICVLEAMKMRQSLRADWSGVVKTINVIPGQQVQDGDPIAELE